MGSSRGSWRVSLRHLKEWDIVDQPLSGRCRTTNRHIITLIRKQKDSAWTDITQYRKSMLPHSSKTTGTVFWVPEGSIFVEFSHKKKWSILFVINFWPLRSFVVHCVTKAKEENIILQSDNSRPNSTRLCMERILKNGWQVLPLPSYSPYLALRPHILWGRKYKMRGQHYATNTAVRVCWRRAKMKFCRKGIFRLLEVWQKVIDLGGDFLENWIHGEDLTDTWYFLFTPLLDCEINMPMRHGPLAWLTDARNVTHWAGLPSEGFNSFITWTSLTPNKSSLTFERFLATVFLRQIYNYPVTILQMSPPKFHQLERV
jgi:hypothetical protein